MKTSLAIVVCAVAAVLMMFAPSKASAGGRYYSDGYGYAYGYCCPGCGYVRGRGFNRRYAYGRGYAYDRYGYGRGYPRGRAYARRSARRGW
jgi:hypothetical protein